MKLLHPGQLAPDDFCVLVVLVVLGSKEVNLYVSVDSGVVDGDEGEVRVRVLPGPRDTGYPLHRWPGISNPLGVAGLVDLGAGGP